MKVLITGGTGFIGTALIEALLDLSAHVTVLSRQPASKVKNRWANPVSVVSSLSDISASASFDAVINLAGEGIIDKRWTASRKLVLMDSRIGLTDSLINVLEKMTHRPKVLISGSAIGYYGAQPPDRALAEDNGSGNDFAARLCAQWEKTALRAEALGIRTCIVRTGIVLHPSGGALKKMLPAFRFGLGGPIASGQQMMSWIHREDIVQLLIFLLKQDICQGIYNGVAPNPVSNAEFATRLAKALKRPAILPMPALILRGLLGESSLLLTEGQHVLATKIERAGFRFVHPSLSTVFSALNR